jgi:glycosyltransferase involved in cell wall biosynthesis
MKLLVISHPAVLPINQAFYAEVERQTGWTLSLVVPDRWSNEYAASILPRRLESLRGCMYQIPVWNQGSVPLHVYKSTLGWLFRKEKPDAVYVHHEPYGFATVQAYLANQRTGRVPIGFYAAQNIIKKYPWPVARAERWVMAHTSFCCPVTGGALDVLRSKGYSGLAEVLPLAVDIATYYPRREDADSHRLRLGIPLDRFVIGFLGRLVSEKGLLTLVRALALIGDREWTCVLAGKGDQEAELRMEIARRGLTERVLLVGYVPHKQAPEWISFFDVLALPSETRGNWKEQFGRVLIEANACGTSVIGTTCGEIPAVIERTGGGLVVPEGNPERLAEALLELLEKPELRHRLAANGRRVVAQEYGQEHLARRFAGLIEQALKQRRP